MTPTQSLFHHPVAAPFALIVTALITGCASMGRDGGGSADDPARGPMGGPMGGPVVAVGGGGTTDAIVAEMLRLAKASSGGTEVVVLPYASGREDRGVGSVEMWLRAGADAARLAPESGEAGALIDAADIVWMGGGSQFVLLDSLEALNLVERVRAAHERGALVGGTSAGAAVLGTSVISGSPEPDAYVADALVPRPGLDLIRGALIDQHFRERRREGRLITALINGDTEPLGLGVSESTAAIVHGSVLGVLGEGVVLAFDAQGAELLPPGESGLLGVRGMTLAVLRPGSQFRMPALGRR